LGKFSRSQLQFWQDLDKRRKRTIEKRGEEALIYIKDEDWKSASNYLYVNLPQYDRDNDLDNWYAEKRVGYHKLHVWNVPVAMMLKLTYGYTPKTIRRRKTPNSAKSIPQTPEIDLGVVQQ
jgi:hypothetical protein